MMEVLAYFAAFIGLVMFAALLACADDVAEFIADERKRRIGEGPQ
jgi:hypothetical protein